MRFADDVLLIARSAGELEGMLGDLAREAEEAGLQLHFGKTKVLCNKFGREDDRRTELKVKGKGVEVLPEGASTKYLGRALRLDAHNEAEIENRINIAWRRFMSLKAELCNRHFPLSQRLRLFGATVSQTLLYGSGTWTLHDGSTRKLRTAQRKMLRSMVVREGRGQRIKKGQSIPTRESKSEAEQEDAEDEEEEETEDTSHTDSEDRKEEEKEDRETEEESTDEGEGERTEDEDASGEELEPWPCGRTG